jgi:hypothetical protein
VLRFEPRLIGDVARIGCRGTLLLEQASQASPAPTLSSRASGAFRRHRSSGISLAEAAPRSRATACTGGARERAMLCNQRSEMTVQFLIERESRIRRPQLC